MMGHRSIYHDGWRAVCPWPGTSFTEAGAVLRRADRQGQADRARCEGLGALPRRRGLRREPQPRRREPREADRDDRARGTSRRASTTCCRSTRAARRASPISGRRSRSTRTSYTYYPGTQMVPVNAGPNVLNRPHSITADVEIPKGGAEGALLSAGDVQGGFCLLRAGRQAPLRLQLRRQRLLPRGIERCRCPRDVTSCASSSR